MIFGILQQADIREIDQNLTTENVVGNYHYEMLDVWESREKVIRKSKEKRGPVMETARKV